MGRGRYHAPVEVENLLTTDTLAGTELRDRLGRLVLVVQSPDRPGHRDDAVKIRIPWQHVMQPPGNLVPSTDIITRADDRLVKPQQDVQAVASVPHLGLGKHRITAEPVADTLLVQVVC